MQSQLDTFSPDVPFLTVCNLTVAGTNYHLLKRKNEGSNREVKVYVVSPWGASY